jgi:hypothetical protein
MREAVGSQEAGDRSQFSGGSVFQCFSGRTPEAEAQWNILRIPPAKGDGPVEYASHSTGQGD